jgi:hypothetical protein
VKRLKGEDRTASAGDGQMRQNVNIGDERLFGKYGEVAVVEQAELLTRNKDDHVGGGKSDKG